MTYTTISAVASHISRTHSAFAEMDINKMSAILDKFAAAISSDKALVGATWKARTLPEYGDLNTLITINKLPNGWECVEQIDR